MEAYKKHQIRKNIATLWLIGWSLHIHIKACDPPHTVELSSCIRLAGIDRSQGRENSMKHFEVKE
jgi:hypothetical protein